MNHALSQDALNQAFTNARTFNKFDGKEVSDATLKQIVELASWGPTAFNMQPARFVFLKSAEAKAKLKPALMEGNQEKSMAAPVVAIVAMDSQFYQHLPEQFPAMDVKGMFESNEALAQSAAFRNGSMQGAYFIIAARMLGLDCGPMSGFNPAAVDAEFFADGRYKTNFLINLGYGDASGNWPRGPRLAFDKIAKII